MARRPSLLVRPHGKERSALSWLIRLGLARTKKPDEASVHPLHRKPLQVAYLPNSSIEDDVSCMQSKPQAPNPDSAHISRRAIQYSSTFFPSVCAYPSELLVLQGVRSGTRRNDEARSEQPSSIAFTWPRSGVCKPHSQANGR